MSQGLLNREGLAAVPLKPDSQVTVLRVGRELDDEIKPEGETQKDA